MYELQEKNFQTNHRKNHFQIHYFQSNWYPRVAINSCDTISIRYFLMLIPV